MENNGSYKIISKFYDLFDIIFVFGGKGNPRLGLLESINNEPKRVLDVCVGTAESSLILASNNSKNTILGIDISEDMLANARRKISQKKLSNLEVQNMSATEMQLANKSFDVVMISFALHEFEKEFREKVFQEIARVLKPGGRLCVIDFARQNNWQNRVFMKAWTIIEPPCFTEYLSTNWREHLQKFGLIYKSEQEYSFSNLYILQKE
jgi:ubiquinone/menaquinone biosynthesis C-methylase UbiE